MKQLSGNFYYREHANQDPRWMRGQLTITEDGYFGSFREDLTVQGDYFLPGFCDVHCHIGFVAVGQLATPQEALAQAEADRDCGILAIRDCGNLEYAPGILGNRALPPIIRCGRHIARPKRYMRLLPIEVENLNDLPQVMASQAEQSDGWVKIVADWIDRSNGADSDLDPLWPTKILKEGIAAAHQVGARVTAHAFSHKAIAGLLEAGIDCIEHGSGIDEDQAQECASRGIPVTPTLLQVELFDEFAAQAGKKYPIYAATMQKMWERRREHFVMLHDAGVQLLPGTDSGGYQPHGELGRELMLWERGGVSASEIIDFATWRVRDFLGIAAIELGARADYLRYSSDPTGDLMRALSPEKVALLGREFPSSTSVSRDNSLRISTKGAV
ncbi:amidohydrolase family protein [Varibaculum vaginae]|uniref:amidohydrolase family protein n=1 Tax=Varibaculum vaginae TaxID=2364797 RepID=UPI000F08490F|nr:amidohydrolase family protein [Varibaculum vaginae]